MRKSHMDWVETPLPHEEVRLKEAGNIAEIVHMARVNRKCHIERLDNERYINLNTGEVKDFVHSDVAVADQLDELCRMMGIKRSEFLISAITSEYDKMQGNPKLKDMLEQFKQITETMKQMTGQANAGTPAGIGDGAGGEGEA